MCGIESYLNESHVIKAKGKGIYLKKKKKLRKKLFSQRCGDTVFVRAFSERCSQVKPSHTLWRPFSARSWECGVGTHG